MAFARALKAEQSGPDAAARIAELEAQRARLVDLAATGALSTADIRPKIDALKTELARLERSQDAKPSSTAVKAEAARAVKAVEDLPALIEHATPAQVQEALQPWLAAAVLDRKAGTLTVDVNVLPILSTARSGPAGDFAV